MGRKTVTIALTDEAYEIVKDMPPGAKGYFISQCILRAVKEYGEPWKLLAQRNESAKQGEELRAEEEPEIRLEF